MRTSLRRLSGALVLGVIGLVASCGSQVMAGGEVADLLYQIQNAPSLTAHQGVRLVESFYNHSGKDDTVAYREEVITDGQGRFSMTPVEVISGASVDNQTFEILLRSREGFNWHYRDFLVRDLESFLNNYTLRSAGRLVTIAGRECYELDVTRKDGSSRWEVAMDIETGIVLSYREYDRNDRLYSSMVYESVTFTPDLVGVTYHQSKSVELDLLSVQDPIAVLGFDPLIPKLLPDSAFRFVSAHSIDDGNGGTWLKLEYTDGVQTIQYLDCGLSLAPLKGGFTGATPGQDLEEKIQLFRAGPVTVLQASISGHQLIVVGKVPQLDLQLLIESAIQ